MSESKVRFWDIDTCLVLGISVAVLGLYGLFLSVVIVSVDKEESPQPQQCEPVPTKYVLVTQCATMEIYE